MTAGAVDLVLGTASDNSGGGTGDYVTGVYIITLTAVTDAGRSKFPVQEDVEVDGRVVKRPKLDEQGNQIFEEQLRWEFRFDEVDSRRATEAQQACIGQTLYRWTSKRFGIGPSGPSKPRGYYEALLGRRMADGEVARLSAVLHQQARATVRAENGKVTGFDLTPIDEMVETPT